MRKIISGIVKALADFVEFEDAVDLGMSRGTINDTHTRLISAQRDAYWQRFKRAEHAERGGTLDDGSFLAELGRANHEITMRRLERKRLAKRRELDRAEARAMKEILQSA